MATGIRDNERNGRAKLVVVEEGQEPAEMTKVSNKSVKSNIKFDRICMQVATGIR